MGALEGKCSGSGCLASRNDGHVIFHSVLMFLRLWKLCHRKLSCDGMRGRGRLRLNMPWPACKLAKGTVICDNDGVPVAAHVHDATLELPPHLWATCRMNGESPELICAAFQGWGPQTPAERSHHGRSILGCNAEVYL